MKRKVGGFDIDWIGDDRIEVTRNNPPGHRYQYETSPDRRRVKRLHDLARRRGRRRSLVGCRPMRGGSEERRW